MCGRGGAPFAGRVLLDSAVRETAARELAASGAPAPCAGPRGSMAAVHALAAVRALAGARAEKPRLYLHPRHPHWS